MSAPARHRRTPQRPVRALFGVMAAGVTTVAVLGGLGLMPSSATLESPVGSGDGSAAGLRQTSYDGSAAASDQQPSRTPAEGSADSPGAAEPADDADRTPSQEALPADSGHGRRVVFSESRQRVWLVSGKQRVKHTYLVSGSIYDNLDLGSYEVYSRSKDAWGIDDSGAMHYFVRFAQGDRAAIGFHDIPVADGRPVQTAAQLGTPQSHGCIRQLRPDAQRLWRFAPIGTTVVVTA